ncbi:MFS transporter [Pleomorphomonas sp. PLEO]|uniref:MFS transporter n=1 Tax=Pleomorphomonas sp. PLEO TaxID=3239306 RepID=UPI00351F1ED5
MRSALSIVYGNPRLRVSAIGIFFFGFTGAATSPYYSLIGIHELGLSNTAFAVVSFCAAIVNVSASVAAGILADRLGRFRLPILAVCLAGVIGYLLVYFLPTVAVFTVASLMLIPVFGALNSLIFAYVRAGSEALAPREMIAVNSAIRAVISASWVLVPGIVGFALAGRPSMLPAFLLAGLACAVCFLLFAVLVREQAGERVERREPSYAFLASLKQIGSVSVWPHVVAIALITSMLHVNGTVLPLIVTGQAGGSPADVGTIVGIVALLEVVFIIVWGWIEARTSSVLAASASAAFYSLYLALLGLSHNTVSVYLLTGISGFGAAGIIAIPITYLQNLIARRAGLGSSLIAVNVFLSGGLSALLFSLGTSISDYTGASMLGAAAGLLGALLLILLRYGVIGGRSS